MLIRPLIAFVSLAFWSFGAVILPAEAANTWKVGDDGKSASTSLTKGQFASLSLACGESGKLSYKVAFRSKSYKMFFIDLDEGTKVFDLSGSGRLTQKAADDFDQYLSSASAAVEESNKSSGGPPQHMTAELQTDDYKKTVVKFDQFAAARSEVLKNCASGGSPGQDRSSTDQTSALGSYDVSGFRTGMDFRTVQTRLQQNYRNYQEFDNFHTPPRSSSLAWIARGNNVNAGGLIDSVGVWFSDPQIGRKALGINHFQDFDPRTAPSREATIDALTAKYGQQSFATPAPGTIMPSIFWWYQDSSGSHAFDSLNECFSLRMPNLVGLLKARGMLRTPPADLNKTVLDYKREFYAGSTSAKYCHGSVLRVELGLIPNDTHRFTWMTTDVIDVDAIITAGQAAAKARQDSAAKARSNELSRPYGAVPKL